ncbi:Gfo/Idh/MocA family protein [Clostridium lacusfryxellense]|uniref:Gfo/Idh/MocA family protein n=1 Tax=Clostridium lacusfryxellense TaxID=205328 RepID=UPI001C0DA367|nr:Gfo/Idh/MocA family oxidoreductase [Clostridium lacusfryxellense]MBU3113280.1 Gfo/Idh/MocA family oxidoreductase [Clostridium lacusfryxellense]
METKKKLKIGLIGLGNIGAGQHIKYLPKMDNVEVVGVCDIIKEKADRFAADCNTKAYYNYIDLFDNSGLEAVIIAVPHYDHTPIAVEAFNRGLHVLCEKPIAVHINDAKKIMDAYEKAKEKNPNIGFALMFQERTYPIHKKIKDILDGGELGKLIRVSWINTAWFRSQAYYNSGGWRATWGGEGGGILTNQCPHNLDLYQWMFGVPNKISGHAHIGKFHDIEVEDEVTAYLEHENGMVGHFIVTTGETPGTNRMEIVGENGKLIFENNKLVFYRNRISMLKFCKETKESFGNVECWYTEIPVNENEPQGHSVVTSKFVDVILNTAGEFVAHGNEGIKSVTLANGIMLSSFTGKIVDVPFNGDEYENKLKELIKTSKFVKVVNDNVEADMSKSFSS